MLGTNGCFGLLATKSITDSAPAWFVWIRSSEWGGIVYRDARAWLGRAMQPLSFRLRVARNGCRGRKSWTTGQCRPSMCAGRRFPDQAPAEAEGIEGTFSQGQDIRGAASSLGEERAEMLAVDPSSAEVIFPLFNGQDLNTMPRLEPYRWVIYFRDWPEAQARQYGAAFRRVEELVKPYRDGLTGQIHQDCSGNSGISVQHGDEVAARNLACVGNRVTKHVTFRKVPTNNIYNTKTKIYFLRRWSEFAVLQSSHHQEWAFWTCGTLGASTLNYSTSYALETWAMPALDGNEELESLGERYHMHRESLMVGESVGLTHLYNRFHDQSDDDPRMETMRKLHREIDLAVARAYGWDGLDLEHGYHAVPYLPENDRLRFTISDAGLEVPRRLSELNHQRYEEEVIATSRRGFNPCLRTGRTTSAATPQPRSTSTPFPPTRANTSKVAEPR
ncbi:MAG: hypothetical protein IPK97_17800 [Ahniella sp.]|nr:hypothetical protein [Ahniella sp.]